LWHEYFTERIRSSCLGLLISIPKIPGETQMYEFLNTYAFKNLVGKRRKHEEKNS
jgi:hypothetical protein